MLTQKEVQHIAKLARLGLTEKEIGKFQRELSSILDYVERLKKVDVAKVESTSHSLTVENVMRKDQSFKFDKKLLDGRLKVKKILQ